MASYKIKDLAALSGIKAHTIRIWEKRYGLLNPDRDNAKVRSYTGEDLKLLLNISILYNAGWKISKIAALTPDEIRNQSNHITADHQSKNAVVTLFIEALLQFDHKKFERVLDKAIEKEGFENVYRYYLLPFLKRIGILWIVNTISPAQEHMISNLIRQKLIVAIDGLPASNNNDVDAVLLTPSEQYHELGLLYYCYALRKKGENIIYLGVDVPVDALLKTIHDTHPKKLVLSMVTGSSESETQAYLSQLSEEADLPIYLGGAHVESIPLPNAEKLFYINKLITV